MNTTTQEGNCYVVAYGCASATYGGLLLWPAEPRNVAHQDVAGTASVQATAIVSLHRAAEGLTARSEQACRAMPACRADSD